MLQNQVLLDLLKGQYNVFLRFATTQCVKKEIAEDVLQSVVCKLCATSIKVEVRNPKAFLFTMIKRMHQNYKKVNRKYFMVGDVHGSDGNISLEDYLFENAAGCSFEGDLMDAFSFHEVKKAAERLPTEQREAVLSALNGEELGEALGENPSAQPRYNSLKTNRRLAVLKLRKQFGGKKDENL